MENHSISGNCPTPIFNSGSISNLTNNSAPFSTQYKKIAPHVPPRHRSESPRLNNSSITKRAHIRSRSPDRRYRIPYNPYLIAECKLVKDLKISTFSICNYFTSIILPREPAARKGRHGTFNGRVKVSTPHSFISIKRLFELAEAGCMYSQRLELFLKERKFSMDRENLISLPIDRKSLILVTKTGFLPPLEESTESQTVDMSIVKQEFQVSEPGESSEQQYWMNDPEIEIKSETDLQITIDTLYADHLTSLDNKEVEHIQTKLRPEGKVLNSMPLLARKNPETGEYQDIVQELEQCPLDQIKVRNWNNLDPHLKGLSLKQHKQIKADIAESIRKFLLLTSEQRNEWFEDLLIVAPTQGRKGPMRGNSVFARAQGIPTFKLLGLFAGEIYKEEDLLRKQRTNGCRNLGDYSWGRGKWTISAEECGNVLCIINTAQLPGQSFWGARNNVISIPIGDCMIGYITIIDIPSYPAHLPLDKIPDSSELFVPYGSDYQLDHLEKSLRLNDTAAEKTIDDVLNIITNPDYVLHFH